MFRQSSTGQFLVAPKSDSNAPSDWTGPQNLADDFHVLVSHGYKGYFYYTGSAFPAAKPTRARVAHTGSALRAHVECDDPHMPGTLEFFETDKPEFLGADFVALNILTPSGDRLLVAVNPRGETYAERNRELGVELPFTASAATGDTAWTADFELPFDLLGLEGKPGEGIGFDVVRQEQGHAMLSTWTRAATMPPYNKIFDYPVFHYSPLYLDEKGGELPAMADALAGLAVERVSPESVEVGHFAEVVLKVTLGERGMQPGGQIRVRHAAEVIDTGSMWWLEEDWSEIQGERPGGVGYVKVDAEGPFEVDARRTFAYIDYTGDKPLPAGGVVTVTLGDRSEGGPGVQAQRVAMPDHPIEVDVDPLGRGACEPVLPWPAIDVTPGEAEAFVVSVPGAVPGAEAFEICVRAVDHQGNIAAGFTGTVRLTTDAADSTLPMDVEFKPEHRGARIVEATIESKGTFAVHADAGKLRATSNYICTDGSFGDGWIVYGDVHTHSGSSDGYYAPMWKYRESRHLRGLAFWSLTDHDFDQTPDKWAMYQEVAARCDQPGRFAAILGYEWTPSAGHGPAFARRGQASGHYCVLFPELTGDCVRSDEDRGNTAEKLLEVTSQMPGVKVIPHYHGGRAPVGENSPAIEIVAWGGKVSDTQSDVSRGLGVLGTIEEEGWKLGIIGGTDHGGEGMLATRPDELCVARVDAITREGVMAALDRRSVYASSWFRVLMSMRVNGVEQGGELTCGKDEPRTVEVKVASRPSAIWVELRRGSKTIGKIGNQTTRDFVRTFTFTDDEPLEKDTFYTVRLRYPADNFVWSSPVWVSVG